MAARRPSVTVNIEMGQGFKDALPDVVRRVGGRVWSSRLNAPFYTLVVVRATFYGKTVRQIEDALWAVWPSCSIGVRSVGCAAEEE